MGGARAPCAPPGCATGVNKWRILIIAIVFSVKRSRKQHRWGLLRSLTQPQWSPIDLGVRNRYLMGGIFPSCLNLTRSYGGPFGPLPNCRVVNQDPFWQMLKHFANSLVWCKHYPCIYVSCTRCSSSSGLLKHFWLLSGENIERWYAVSLFRMILASYLRKHTSTFSHRSRASPV